MFREAARRFIATEITPFHPEWEKVGVVPRELWRKAGEAGLLCPNVPAEYGGPGANFLYNVVITEESGNEVTVSSNFVMFEIRRAIYGDRYFAGRFEHRLRKEGNSWKIAFKKIELLNNDAPIENLTFII